MWVPVNRLRQFQDLVKQYDFRFMSNPLIMSDRAYVHIDGDHLPMTNCNAFFSDWNRLTTPIAEKTPTFRKRLMNKIKGIFQG